jgi:hypothetical protein
MGNVDFENSPVWDPSQQVAGVLISMGWENTRDVEVLVVVDDVFRKVLVDLGY